ncbi:MAG: 30S ribosomal protein S20 [Aquificaceae bacterium]
MPNTKQAEKRVRRDAKRRVRNRYHLSKMRTYIRRLRDLVNARKLEEAKSFLPEVISLIYHTASKGIIHKREASRRASRASLLLNKAIKSAESQK